MVFSSAVFLFLFFPALLILYYLPWVKNITYKNIILLIFSLFFYAWGEPFFVFLMIGAIMINWLAGLLISSCPGNKAGSRKVLLITVVSLDIAMIFVFKYLTFLTENLAVITSGHTPIIKIALPIGISFFTFQLMSYVFDIYYGKSDALKNPLYVALYISFFPQLIAGPIVRYQQIEKQLFTRTETFDSFTAGMRRFIYGLGKKMLLANFLGMIADDIFNHPQMPLSVATAWLGAIAYTLQIYFDFSGYSDMAIGLGKMFGFDFPENFNYPYIAESITDFWRRWHISLSTWFRDYVYIPLGGNRVSNKKHIFNLFIVWLLTGIWHGANWTFLVWGLFYFVILLIEKKTDFAKRMGWFSHIYSLIIITIAWVIFRSQDIKTGIAFIGHMFGVGADGFVDKVFLVKSRSTYTVLIASLIGATPLINKLFAYLREKKLIFIEWLWLIAVFGLSVLSVVSASYNPFIYFNF